jgi:hypothetical protein
MSPSEARKRARQIYIESHGQADYDEIKLTLRLEGLGDHEISALRQWRSRDIKGGQVKPDELAKKFEHVSKSAARVVKKLSLPDNMSVAEKVECAKLADLEDTHERMLRVVNAAADRLEIAIPDIHLEKIGDANTLAGIASSVADSAIKLRLSLIQVREQTMKVIGASDDKGAPVHAEIMPPLNTKPIGLAAAVQSFKAGG